MTFVLERGTFGVASMGGKRRWLRLGHITTSVVMERRCRARLACVMTAAVQIAWAADSPTGDAQRRPLQVIAHRGAHLAAPENTLPAIEAAIEMGADYVEVDVRSTADGRLVLMHDPDVDRTTDGTGFVCDLTFDAIERLDAGSWAGGRFARTRVPSLEEALEVARGRAVLILDWKDATPEALVHALRQVGAFESTMILGSIGKLHELARREPRARLIAEIWNGSDIRRVAGCGFHVDAVSPPIDSLSVTLAAACHEAGWKVFADMQGDEESCAVLQGAARAGADAVLTDHPALLLECLLER